MKLKWIKKRTIKYNKTWYNLDMPKAPKKLSELFDAAEHSPVKFTDDTNSYVLMSEMHFQLIRAEILCLELKIKNADKMIQAGAIKPKTRTKRNKKQE
jgi:hypothetical protein